MAKGSRRSGKEPKNKGTKMRSDVQGPSDGEIAPIDLRIQTEIGKHLRAMYDDVINEPVPSKFMELLKKLEQSTTQKN